MLGRGCKRKEHAGKEEEGGEMCDEPCLRADAVMKGRTGVRVSTDMLTRSVYSALGAQGHLKSLTHEKTYRSAKIWCLENR